MQFSIIVPVYNRPAEVDELLDSLSRQTYRNFEVLIIEDGSKDGSHKVVEKYENKLLVKYFYKKNEGPGPTRNYGSEKAHGDYLIFFDSDCIIPPDYLQIVHDRLSTNYTDAFGGPDATHPSFTPVQKAIGYSMTSFFTTGGIRGKTKSLENFHPRSFNMGYSRRVYETTNGFARMRFGEDIDMSLRIFSNGFQSQLIPEAFVYHKRRTDFRKFYRQVFNSGIARIHLYKRHPESLKLVHFLPLAFVIGHILLLVLAIAFPLVLVLPVIYSGLLFFGALFQNKNLRAAFLAIPAAYTQLFGYGLGFAKAVWFRLIKRYGEFSAFEHNFYK